MQRCARGAHHAARASRDLSPSGGDRHMAQREGSLVPHVMARVQQRHVPRGAARRVPTATRAEGHGGEDAHCAAETRVGGAIARTELA